MPREEIKYIVDPIETSFSGAELDDARDGLDLLFDHVSEMHRLETDEQGALPGVDNYVRDNLLGFLPPSGCERMACQADITVQGFDSGTAHDTIISITCPGGSFDDRGSADRFEQGDAANCKDCQLCTAADMKDWLGRLPGVVAEAKVIVVEAEDHLNNARDQERAAYIPRQRGL